MAEKILNTRIQLKYDTLANWNASTFKLKAGELAIVTLGETKDGTVAGDANQHPILFKVGTGNHTFSQLPFASALAADVYAWAKAETIVLTDKKLQFKTGDDVKKEVVFDYITEAEVRTILNGYKTKQTAYSANGSTIKTITSVTQNENGEVAVTYEDIAFPQVEIPNVVITDDADGAEVPEAETVDVYKNLTASEHTLTEELVQVATKKAVDNALEAAKKYADDNDANDNTEYHIEYDKTAKEIRLVAGANADSMVIATDDFIKDGMIESVVLSEDGLNLVITWNTDAGKDITTIPLSGLVDAYTIRGVDGTTVKVTASTENNEHVVGAEVKEGSLKDAHIAADAAIAKSKFANDVQTSLGLADSAVQPAALNDYVKIADATGYGDILTKTEAATKYQPVGDYATKAQGDLADTALQAITTTADNGLKVTGKNQIDIDDTVVFVFDCGSATKNIAE